MSNSSRKNTFIGAGSTVFAKNLLGDILSFPELGGSTICLFDINESRLKTSEVVARRIAQPLGRSGFDRSNDGSRPGAGWRFVRDQHDSGWGIQARHGHRF